MTTTLTPLPAPTWLRELTNARATYEELLGWPVSIQVSTRELVAIVGATLGAVGMPARLGAQVRQELGFAMLCGPIVADPGGTFWTFLTKPAGALRPDVASDLDAVRVHVATRGTCVEIPCDTKGSTIGGWRWVERPVPNRPLPPGSAVIAMVRRLTYDDGHLAA
jgi:hypothetical protein